MMHHAIHNGGGNDGVSEVIAEVLEVDVGREQCRPLAVTAVDDLEEQRGIFSVLLLQPVKAQFIDKEDVGGGVLFELLVEAQIRAACHQLHEHVGSGGIAAAVEVSASDEKQGLGDMAFSGAGVSCNHKPLLTADEVQVRDLQDLCLVHPGLEGKVEVRKELSLREPGLFDSSLDPSFDSGVCLDGQEPFKEFGGRERLLCCIGELLVKDFLYSQKLQGFQMVPDPCQGLLRHSRYPL